MPRDRIEACLLAAANRAQLDDPFVQVLELGDFSVGCRSAGLLTDVKGLVTARSRLRAAVMDTLHEDGIEIVSPSFMNQRVLQPGSEFIPAPVHAARDSEQAPHPEAVVFDKAEEAESLEKLKSDLAALDAELSKLSHQLKETTDERSRADLERRLERLATRRTTLEKVIAVREETIDRS